MIVAFLQVFAENGVPAGGQHPKPIKSDHGTVLEPRRQTDVEPVVKSLFTYTSTRTIHIHTLIHAKTHTYIYI